MDLMTIYNYLKDNINHANIVFNTLFLITGARPAFLLQSINYNEDNITDPITSNIISVIEKILPENIIHQTISQGELFFDKSEKEIDYYVSSSKLGVILGYDYDYYYGTDSYSIFVNAHLDNEKINIYGMASNSSEINESLKNRILKMTNILKCINKNWYVDYDIKKDLNMNEIIEKIENNVILNEDEKNHICNELWNISFLRTQSIVKNKNIHELTINHKFYIISILKFTQHNAFEIFYPFTQRTSEEYGKIIEDYEFSLFGDME